MTATVIGTVSDLRRYPVKSMLGEQLERASLTDKGVAGDRVFALVDDETGKVVSVKRPKRWGRMVELPATNDVNPVRVPSPGSSRTASAPPSSRARPRPVFPKRTGRAEASRSATPS